MNILKTKSIKKMLKRTFKKHMVDTYEAQCGKLVWVRDLCNATNCGLKRGKDLVDKVWHYNTPDVNSELMFNEIWKELTKEEKERVYKSDIDDDNRIFLKASTSKKPHPPQTIVEIDGQQYIEEKD